MLKLSFSMIDQFGNRTDVSTETPEDSYDNQFEHCVESFKNFLLACSYPKGLTDKIQIIEE
jgi:hypothetical protein